jgi:hypothetical protein
MMLAIGHRRWTGLASIAAGGLLALGALLHPAEMGPDALANPVWVASHAVLLVAVILVLCGLFELHTAQAERAGVLGAAGFALSVVGIALVVAAIVVEAYVFPTLAADPAGRALLSEGGPLLGGPLGVTLMLTSATGALGTLLLGVAIQRAGALPRVAGALLALGGPLLSLTPPLPQPAFTVGALLVSAAFIWIGLALRGASRHVTRAEVVGA